MNLSLYRISADSPFKNIVTGRKIENGRNISLTMKLLATLKGRSKMTSVYFTEISHTTKFACVCTCGMNVFVQAFSHMCGCFSVCTQSPILGFSLNCFLSHILKNCLAHESRTCKSAKLDSLLALEMLYLCLPSAGMAGGPPQSPNNYAGAAVLNCSLHI